DGKRDGEVAPGAESGRWLKGAGPGRREDEGDGGGGEAPLKEGASSTMILILFRDRLSRNPPEPPAWPVPRPRGVRGPGQRVAQGGRSLPPTLCRGPPTRWGCRDLSLVPPT